MLSNQELGANLASTHALLTI